METRTAPNLQRRDRERSRVGFGTGVDSRRATRDVPHQKYLVRVFGESENHHFVGSRR